MATLAASRQRIRHSERLFNFSFAFGGLKQSGLGGDDGGEGLQPHLEAETGIFEAARRIASPGQRDRSAK